MSGSATILRADARSLPLADATVDLVVTSPPYFALRSYQDGGEHYGEQIGAEPTPREYIAALIDCTREWMRVLKPGGSIWVNLGDTYASKANAGVSVGVSRRGDRAEVIPPRVNTTAAAPYKSLLMLPERYRIAAVDELGLTARAVVIWSKPNGMPESVTDRVRRSHEDWVHLTKQPRYYSAVDEIREHATTVGKSWEARKAAGEPGRNRGGSNGNRAGIQTSPTTAVPSFAPNPLGKLPGSVWEIATEPLKVPDDLGIDHFAAFPTEWPRRIILGWSPVGGVVVDPFGGTGTTALVAKVLGRCGVSTDRSADYCRLARWRTTDPGQLAKAMRVPAPPAVHQDQGDLFAAARAEQ